MCGIVGVVGDIGIKEEKVFTDLLYVDGLRGHHSTGVFSVLKRNDNFRILKRASPALDVIRNKGYDNVLKDFSRVLLGHNRYATMGAVSAINAHPFKHGDIIGVHNGTLTGQYLLPDYQKFDVDSENIMYAIDKEGIEETAKKLKGAYALVWWDTKKRTLNFFRNNERPLYYRFTTDLKTIVYASESKMIDLVVSRRGLSMDKTLWYPDPGDHVSIDMSLKAKGPLDKRIKVTKMETYIPPVLTYTRDSNYTLWPDPIDDNVVQLADRRKEETDHLPEFIEGGEGLLMPRDILDQLSSECGWCCADIKKVKNVGVAWDDSVTALCESCESFTAH